MITRIPQMVCLASLLSCVTPNTHQRGETPRTQDKVRIASSESSGAMELSGPPKVRVVREGCRAENRLDKRPEARPQIEFGVVTLAPTATEGQGDTALYTGYRCE